MSTFVIRLHSPAAAIATMNAILDLSAHNELIPFTTVEPAVPAHQGLHFVARTGVGPVGFADHMSVIDYTAPTATSPGRCLITKSGRIVRGNVELVVSPSGHGCNVEWRQKISILGVPRPLEPLVALAVQAGYRAVLTRLLSRADQY